MSGYMGDITNYLSAGFTSAATAAKTNKASSGYDLDMQDFLTLMVTELQCQSLDATADTSDMLNQMVMMQMVSALTNMTDASIMSYAASLVGKTVTVGQYDDQGVLQEIVGEVTGTGTMGGEQVVFVDDKYYYMSQIMAVGTLPKIENAEGSKPEDAENDKISGVTGNDDTASKEQESGSSKIEVPEVPEVPEVIAPEVPQVLETNLSGAEE